MAAWHLIVLSTLSAGLYGGTPTEVSPRLAALHAAFPRFEDRFAQVVRDAVGTPYHDGPLGEGPNAPYDSDPLIDLGRVDCVTFVEQCAALAASRDYDSAVDLLQRIRYAGGAIDFETRNHFMLADWIPNNPWCADITATLELPLAEVTRTISKADFFKRVKAPELGQTLPDRRMTVSYIPIAEAGRMAEKIDGPALVVFIGHVDWLFALHCGVLLPEPKGGVALYHASSAAGAVTKTTLATYAAEQSKRYLGVTVHRIGDPSARAASE